MMSYEKTGPVHHNSGLGGTVKLVLILAVLALACLSGLAVLDVISLGTMSEWAVKLGLLAAICALATAVIWLLTRTTER